MTTTITPLIDFLRIPWIVLTLPTYDFQTQLANFKRNLTPTSFLKKSLLKYKRH